MTAAPQAALAAALGGRTVDFDGDKRILVGADLIYCAPTGKVRLDHRGHITDLGRWSDPVDVLAAAYLREVAA